MRRENNKQIKNSKNYEMNKICSVCGGRMKYAYGENYECQQCGRQERSNFGKVKDFLEESGPQPAVIISENTGVSLEYITLLLHEGRIEIPDGSDHYIKCKKCGTDIRYGRFCPECMIAMTKNISSALALPDVGEKPTRKGDGSGKMRFMNKREKK